MCCLAPRPPRKPNAKRLEPGRPFLTAQNHSSARTTPAPSVVVYHDTKHSAAQAPPCSRACTTPGSNKCSRRTGAGAANAARDKAARRMIEETACFDRSEAPSGAAKWWDRGMKRMSRVDVHCTKPRRRSRHKRPAATLPSPVTQSCGSQQCATPPTCTAQGHSQLQVRRSVDRTGTRIMA